MHSKLIGFLALQDLIHLTGINLVIKRLNVISNGRIMRLIKDIGLLHFLLHHVPYSFFLVFFNIAVTHEISGLMMDWITILFSDGSNTTFRSILSLSAQLALPRYLVLLSLLFHLVDFFFEGLHGIFLLENATF